ncbi:hypothetical protein JSY36_18120 [Bacillus sp. H-16]|uniref:HAAS domain-containing protein n=1 Tax=Alteribacter salitolerans TaxID=2912333 RepID=UPI0019642430|nr:hypothetical protein [Alteribacter salitolerans]MBM7097655.1 hypothetical protein [Alteribacter salitolerans]
MLTGGAAYSYFALIGYPVSALAYLLIVATGMKYISSKKLTKKQGMSVFLILGIIPGFLMIGILAVEMFITAPDVVFSRTGNVIAGIISVLTFIVFAIWTKTWAGIVIPIMLFTPGLLLRLTSVGDETALISGWIVSITGIAVYLYLVYRNEKKKEFARS